MATFNEMLQNMVNKDYNELLGLAKIAMDKLMPLCKAVDAEHNGVYMLTSIILVGIGADGTLTLIERKFLKDLLNLDDDEVSSFIKLYDSRMVEMVDKFADSLGADAKAHTLMLLMAVAACDEKISREETALIHKILE